MLSRVSLSKGGVVCVRACVMVRPMPSWLLEDAKIQKESQGRPSNGVVGALMWWKQQIRRVFWLRSTGRA